MDPQMLMALMAGGQGPQLATEDADILKQVVYLQLFKTARNDRGGFRTKRALWDTISMLGNLNRKTQDPNEEIKQLFDMWAEQRESKTKTSK